MVTQICMSIWGESLSTGCWHCQQDEVWMLTPMLGLCPFPPLTDEWIHRPENQAGEPSTNPVPVLFILQHGGKPYFLLSLLTGRLAVV